ncbi:MAG: glycoside hydrolase family 2 protein [Christensenellales bacterium]
MRLLLSGDRCAWEVKGFWPGEPLWTRSVESTVERKGVTPWLPVAVPGGVHGALLRAGLIADPYVEQNSLLCEWVEHRWWVFRTYFEVPEKLQGGHLSLRFEGLDDRAHILLNDSLLGFHEGMFEPAVFDVTGKAHPGARNCLLVIFECPPREQGQIGWTSRTFTQKARFNYKWDFCARLVNVGLWQEVSLYAFQGASMDNIRLTSGYEDGQGVIRADGEVIGPWEALRMDISLGGAPVAGGTLRASGSGAFSLSVTLAQPALWWPNGLGAQPLYEVRLQLRAREELLDTWEGRAGIRSLAFRRCEGAGEDALPYLPLINGKAVYLRGLNLTPLDLQYGDVSPRRYERLFLLLRHMNANLVRVWGGGIVETETFYRLADEQGILVWQEFIQSSSGIENVPSHDPDFLSLLARSASSAIIRTSSHVSLTYRSGGNELSGEDGLPVTEEDPNIRLLGGLCRSLDPGRLFLPSSPSGPCFGIGGEGALRRHDVHGNWQYEGLEKHYRMYNSSDSMLQSEVGTDGMSPLRALATFLLPEHLRVTSMKDSAVWRHHGEWWETLHYRDLPLFGKQEDLHAWIRVSQLMQGESLRYIIQANRRRMYRNCGTILWQLNEPFPNVSCTSLVAYGGWPKHAWYMVRQAFQPLDVSLRYESLLHLPGEAFEVGAFLHSGEEGGEGLLRLQALNILGEVIAGHKRGVVWQPDACLMAFSLSLRIPAQPEGLFFIRLSLLTRGAVAAEQLYFFSQRGADEAPLRAMQRLEEARIAFHKEEGGIRAVNQGRQVCLYLHGEPEGGEGLMADSYFTLFPGESALFLPLEAAPAWRFSSLGQADIARVAMEA